MVGMASFLGGSGRITGTLGSKVVDSSSKSLLLTLSNNSVPRDDDGKKELN